MPARASASLAASMLVAVKGARRVVARRAAAAGSAAGAVRAGLLGIGGRSRIIPRMPERGFLGSLLGEGSGAVHANLRPARLVEAALARGEGFLADNGALVVRTGAKTGRSADDKHV